MYFTRASFVNVIFATSRKAFNEVALPLHIFADKCNADSTDNQFTLPVSIDSKRAQIFNQNDLFTFTLPYRPLLSTARVPSSFFRFRIA